MRSGQVQGARGAGERLLAELEDLEISVREAKTFVHLSYRTVCKNSLTSKL